VKDGATNELITLTGNAQLESAQGWLTGEPIVWNRANNRLSAVNQHMIFRQSFDSLTAKTNSPSPKTNTNLTLPKSSDTAPGVIKHVDQIKNRNF
jgi:lipopolysaccharide export system protein LptA